MVAHGNLFLGIAAIAGTRPRPKSTRRGDDLQQNERAAFARPCVLAASFLRKGSSGFVALFAEKLDARLKPAQDTLGQRWEEEPLT